jgi:hypothetical protein
VLTTRNKFLSLLAIALLSASGIPYSLSGFRSPVSEIASAPALPNSCELLAAEASARMRRAGIWARILILRYENGTAHALCVFQPSRQICAYDDTGTAELDTDSHDPAAIANLLAIRKHWHIKSARFLK